MSPALPRKVRQASTLAFLRFGMTGLCGFAVDFSALIALRGAGEAPLPVATAVAYLLGGVVHYTLTRLWVFPHQRPGGELGKLGRYLQLVALNVVLTLLIVLGLAHTGLDYRVAKLVAVVVLFLSNYVIMPRWVMPHEPPA